MRFSECLVEGAVLHGYALALWGASGGGGKPRRSARRCPSRAVSPPLSLCPVGHLASLAKARHSRASKLCGDTGLTSSRFDPGAHPFYVGGNACWQQQGVHRGAAREALRRERSDRSKASLAADGRVGEPRRVRRRLPSGCRMEWQPTAGDKPVAGGRRNRDLPAARRGGRCRARPGPAAGGGSDRVLP